MNYTKRSKVYDLTFVFFLTGAVALSLIHVGIEIVKVIHIYLAKVFFLG